MMLVFDHNTIAIQEQGRLWCGEGLPQQEMSFELRMHG
jgi:hypothetical protein